MTNQMYATLRGAMNAGRAIRIKYFPNKTGESLVGWRYVLPLDMYTYRGTQYCLCWFTDGSSVVGLTGYRLYFTKNIKDLQEADNNKQQPFAMRKPPIINTQVMSWILVRKGEIE